MKKITLLSITLIYSITSSFAQTSWINYEFTVSPDKQEAFIGALNTFMTSETGKTLPMAFLTENTLGKQEECTHHVSFICEDPDQAGKLLDPTNWENGDYQKMGEAMTTLGTLPRRSFSGMPIVQSSQKPNNGFQMIYAMNVPFSSQMDVATAFGEVVEKIQPLLDENNMELSLHQHIGGDDRNVTHWALESHKDYASMLKAQQKLMQSPEFGKMFSAMGAGNVTNPLTIGRTILMVWNAPTPK